MKERGFWNFLNSPLAEMFFREDYISVNVEKCNLERIKKLFEDFVKIDPTKVNINIVRGDC